MCLGRAGAAWGAQVYTNIRRFKEDLTAYPPHFFICVPLVLDTLYNRVRRARLAGLAAPLLHRLSSALARGAGACWLGRRRARPAARPVPGVHPCCAAGALRIMAAGLH